VGRACDAAAMARDDGYVPPVEDIVFFLKPVG
jgi:hypothetical protein